MRNAIDISKVKHTKTVRKIYDGYDCITYAIKQSELDKHNIRGEFVDVNIPVFYLIDEDHKHNECYSQGPAAITGLTNAYVGRKYRFGHWYYKNYLVIIDDKNL